MQKIICFQFAVNLFAVPLNLASRVAPSHGYCTQYQKAQALRQDCQHGKELGKHYFRAMYIHIMLLNVVL